jgi:hypothetical protein
MMCVHIFIEAKFKVMLQHNGDIYCSILVVDAIHMKKIVGAIDNYEWMNTYQHSGRTYCLSLLFCLKDGASTFL